MTKQILLSLLNCSWQWMLLSGLIWFVATRFRRSNATVHLLWLLSLLSLPILLGLNQFVPAPSIGNTVPELTQAKPIDVSGLAALTTDLPEISSTESDTQSKNQLLAGGKSFFNWETKTDLLLCVWAIGALVMFVRFMFGLYRIHQLRRSAVVADDSYQAICRRLAQQLDISRPVTVCFSDRIASPISFGWLSPYILIPRKLNLEQFELVAAHELAHVQRLDWLTNLFSHLVGVIFFFHPIYHFLNRELVHLRERICDGWVIRLTGARKNYAQCLLDLVRHRDRAIPLALSLNQPSQLESRIDSILKSNRQLDLQLKPRLRLIVATLLLTCLPLLAMAQLVPLKTFQVSLFAQTPEKSEEAVDKTQEKKGVQKAKVEKMGEKGDKGDSDIKSGGELNLKGWTLHIDDVSGDAPDWLELYNLTDSDLNLKGWALMSIDDVSDDTPDWLELHLIDDELNLTGRLLNAAPTSRLDAGEWFIQVDKGVKIPAKRVLLLNDAELLKLFADSELLKKLGILSAEDEQLLKRKVDAEEWFMQFDKGVKIPANRVLLLTNAGLLKLFGNSELLKKLGILSAERRPTMEKDDARNREKNLSPEEHLKQAREKLAQIEERLRQLKKLRKRNVRDLTIAIKNPIEGEKSGKMLLNGNVIEFDELKTHFLNLPEEQKSMLIIQPEREVLHEQIIQVMDIAKAAGIDKIEFAISPAEDKSMEPDEAQEHRSEDSD